MDTTKIPTTYRKMSDGALLAALRQIRTRERSELAEFLAALGELDARHLANRKAYPSAFAFCVGELGLSEDEACRRVRAATACLRFNFILSYVLNGELNLCALSTIGPILTSKNAQEVVARACRKSARSVYRLAAELAPKPDPKDSIRRLPELVLKEPPALPTVSPPAPAAGVPRLPTAESPEASSPPPTIQTIQAPPAPRWDKITPTSPGRDGYTFAAPEDLSGMIRRIKELLWHKNPKMSLGEVLMEVCRFWLKHNDPQLKLAAEGPRPKRRESDPESRRIPEWVKDRVRQRDGGRCAFVSDEGRRCGETAGIEFDHILPYALGGRSDDPDNIREVCAGHNAYLAQLAFGERVRSSGSTGSSGNAGGGQGPESPPG